MMILQKLSDFFLGPAVEPTRNELMKRNLAVDPPKPPRLTQPGMKQVVARPKTKRVVAIAGKRAR